MATEEFFRVGESNNVSVGAPLLLKDRVTWLCSRSRSLLFTHRHDRATPTASVISHRWRYMCIYCTGAVVSTVVYTLL